MMKRILAVISLALALLLPGANALYGWEKAPSFSLPQLDSEEPLSLDDFRGQIVVLDFFNVNCGDCFRVSRELETGIQEYYAARSGNPRGFPVQVVAINSDAAEPEDMETFLDETGLGLVLDDPGFTVLQLYGGSGMPYVAVIDATVTESAAAAPRVVLRQSKYEGLNKIREAIDAITGEPPASEPGTEAGTAPEADLSLTALETERQVTHEITLDMAAMFASDIYVADFLQEYRMERPSMEFSLGFSYRPTRMDFRPQSLGPMDTRLTDERYGLQGSAGLDLNEAIELKIDGGAYEGFQTYRALWMDEYNRIKFGERNTSGGRSGYRDADPWGYNASSGLRWEYFPDAGFADAGISYQHDRVAPGYEDGTPLVRLRDTYDTVGGYLSFENVLTRRLRTMLKGRLDDTTGREVRLTLQGALNYALAENWVMRLEAGYATEDPKFIAKSFSAALERDWHGIWFVSVFGRYYEDTSEIENGISNIAAAPPIETYQAGLGVRRRGNRSTVKIDIGPCISRYDSRPQRNTDFDQLYKDRNWLSLQAAFQYKF